jgi:hypothetical protein
VQVRHAVLALEHSDALELALAGGPVAEQAAPAAQQDRDEVDLDLVEDAGRETELRDRRAVDEHVAVARSLLRSGHRRGDVVDVGDQRPATDVDAGLTAAVDEDRDAVVVVAVPATRGLEGPATSDDGAVAMNSSTTRPLTPPVTSPAPPPFRTQSWRRSPPSPSPLSGRTLGPAMNPSSDIDM